MGDWIRSSSRWMRELFGSTPSADSEPVAVAGEGEAAGEPAGERAVLPRIDAARCSACGKCWTCCPDGAICALTVKTAELLNAAATGAGVSGKPAAAEEAAARLRRSLPALCSRIESLLAQGRVRRLAPETAREALELLKGQPAVSDREKAELDEAFERSLAPFLELPLAATEALFHQPLAGQRGSAELLALAIDPEACQRCGACAELCPERAISMASETPAELEKARVVLRAWRLLPDPEGDLAQRAGAFEQAGELAAAMMPPRHRFPVADANRAQPGSGERLAIRQTLAVVEYQMQKRMAAHLRRLEELGAGLRARLSVVMAESLFTERLATGGEAGTEATGRPNNLSALIWRPEELGERTAFDARTVRRLAEAIEEVERLRSRLANEVEVTGGARRGLVFAGESAQQLAAAFTGSTSRSEVAVQSEGDGSERALELARQLLEERDRETGLLRSARLLTEGLAAGGVLADEGGTASCPGTTTAELSPCPAVLLVSTVKAMACKGWSALNQILCSGLPVKLVLLDDGEFLVTAEDEPAIADPTLLALTHHRACVVATSVAHHDHLFTGVSEALDYSGPAVISLFAPSPTRQGFSPSDTVRVAALAVHSRAHPLARYHAGAEGFLEKRLNLEGNPAAEQAWAADEQGRAITPAQFALSQARFHHELSAPLSDVNAVTVDSWAALPEWDRGVQKPAIASNDGRHLILSPSLARAVLERQQIWATLQELAGLAD